jgi:hypothetical protein
VKKTLITFPRGVRPVYRQYAIRHMPVEMLDHLRLEAARRREYIETILLQALWNGLRDLRREKVTWGDE